MRTRDGSANEESHEAAACWILLFLRGENVRHGFLFHSTHASPLSLPLRLPPFIRPFFFRHAFHDDATFLLIHLLRDPLPPPPPPPPPPFLVEWRVRSSAGEEEEVLCRSLRASSLFRARTRMITITVFLFSSAR